MIAKQLKVGMTIHYQNGLYRVMQIALIAPGNWRAFAQSKLRNIQTGTQQEVRFRADENVERAVMDMQPIEFLYQDGDSFHFMNTENYEQFHMNKDELGDVVNYLTPNLKLQVEMHESKPIGLQLPQTVNVKVIETEPVMKSATVTNSFKAAKIETGATIQVPGFVTEGQIVEIDTTSGDYVGRSKG